MGKDSKIAWCDNTFNPWWGCIKKSAGCLHCYGERLATRYGFDVWGPGKPRRYFKQKHWDEPLKWNKQARKDQKPQRVFCGSMCDIFESHPDVAWERRNIWRLIHNTEWLNWLLLTKRPENVMDMVPSDWHHGFPDNVWMGITAENQEMADERIPLLLQIPAAVRFVSVEPMLERINVIKWLGKCMRCDHHGFVSWTKWTTMKTCGLCMEEMQCAAGSAPLFYREMSSIDWVIAGAESGPNARLMEEDWIRYLRNQCIEAGVPLFYKQKLVNGKKVSMPELDGKIWCEYPKEMTQ